MPIYDLLLIALGVAGLVWLLWGVLRYGVRQGAAGLAVTGATLAGLSAVTNLLLGGAHLIAVLARPLQGRPVGGAAVFEYGFHYYSLVLLGLVVVVPALFLVARVRGVVRGERAAWRVAFWMSFILLAVNAPLIPLQGFAPLLSATAGLGLLALAGARGKLAEREGSRPPFAVGWEVRDIGTAEQFFSSLPRLLALPIYLCFEGTSIAPKVQSLLKAKAVEPILEMPAGTLWPKPRIFHVLADERFAQELAELAGSCAEPELCDHLHAYDANKWLLQWYDAFDDPLLIDESVPEANVQAFCQKSGASYIRREAERPGQEIVKR